MNGALVVRIDFAVGVGRRENVFFVIFLIFPQVFKLGAAGFFSSVLKMRKFFVWLLVLEGRRCDFCAGEDLSGFLVCRPRFGF